jgi:hypothetical protein
MITMLERTVLPTAMTVFDGFTTTATRPLPREYLIPASDDGRHRAVARLLKTHGIDAEELRFLNAWRSIDSSSSG